MPIAFTSLTDRIKDRLRNPLPGAVAHEPMRAVPTGNLKPEFKHSLPPKPGSVLILLFEENGLVKFPLIKRPVYIGAHSGQISLPGGKAEEGEDFVLTALREGEEEVGIDRNSVQVLGCLSNFFVIPSNFMVTPVVGFVSETPKFVPDSFEVDKILRANLDELVAADAIHEKEILAAGKFALRAPHFLIEDEVVWGATAMMLNEFRTILLDILD